MGSTNEQSLTNSKWMTLPQVLPLAAFYLPKTPKPSSDIRYTDLTNIIQWTTFLASKAGAAARRLPPFRPKLTVENIFLARSSDSALRLFTLLPSSAAAASAAFPSFLSTPFFGRSSFGQEAKINRLQRER